MSARRGLRQGLRLHTPGTGIRGDQRHYRDVPTDRAAAPGAFHSVRAGLSPQHGVQQPNGELILSDGLGLTCSTFVLKVFESAKVPLIELTNWPMRPDDNVRHASLLHLMENGIPGRLHPAPPEHVQRVREELPCIRLRPEEVAAAALAERLPASFQQVESGGRWILELVTEGAQEAWI